MTNQASSSFELLDVQIQRWIWTEGWTELRGVQEQAIPAIIDAKQDVIIAAATAAGKTEAAFFPILTKMLRDETGLGLTIYISPLKALINDQFGRLELLCETLEIPVWPWHGDVSSSLKTKFFKKPEGVLLITPESLEAMLCNRGFSIPTLLAKLKYFVVDELHAFIGSERGKQLQSLIQRIDSAIKSQPPRIGLSATLGDMSMAASFLRPKRGNDVKIIESTGASSELKVLIKGYVESTPPTSVEEGYEPSSATILIAEHLFKSLRGSNNLIFPNSRRMVERYAYDLRQISDDAQVPNEFWPHHGSLSKELREETEAALKNKERSASAVCTNTLELGIDIGSVKSIAQIGSPPSVASLRQRLGRSGRRKGDPAILRGYIIEQELTSKSHPMSELREGLVELIAMVSLLLEGWFEPPRSEGLHLSTLVQQLLALISQRGGISAIDAYQILCSDGPFNNVEKADYLELLRHLGQQKLIQQDCSGVLLHGSKGESFVNHYTFYAAFASEEEFRVVSNSRTLGSLPVSSLVSKGDFILFAAKTWLVDDVDDSTKTIFVTQHKTGKVPPFNSPRGQVHDKVRQRMHELYESDAPIPFLDKEAAILLNEGRSAFKRMALNKNYLLSSGKTTLLFTWLGDAVNQTISAMLKREGITSLAYGPALEIFSTESQISSCLIEVARGPMPNSDNLLNDAHNIVREKWDWALPDNLLKKSFASLQLNIEVAYRWIQTKFR